jgi:transposase
MPKRKTWVDPKQAVLDELGVRNSRPQAVRDPLFAKSDFFDARDLVQVKYEMVRKAEVDGASVTSAVEAFGFSRPSFYQVQAALRRDGLAGLLPKKRGPKGARKLRGEVMEFLTAAHDGPGAPAAGAAAELARQVQKRFGVRVHPRSIERALARQKKKLR